MLDTLRDATEVHHLTFGPDPATHTLLIADGFSCCEQISQMTGRHALHLAEVIALALQQDQAQPVAHT